MKAIIIKVCSKAKNRQSAKYFVHKEDSDAVCDLPLPAESCKRYFKLLTQKLAATLSTYSS